jgi:hypothetical protein
MLHRNETLDANSSRVALRVVQVVYHVTEALPLTIAIMMVMMTVIMMCPVN